MEFSSLILLSFPVSSLELSVSLKASFISALPSFFIWSADLKTVIEAFSAVFFVSSTAVSTFTTRATGLSTVILDIFEPSPLPATSSTDDLYAFLIVILALSFLPTASLKSVFSPKFTFTFLPNEVKSIFPVVFLETVSVIFLLFKSEALSSFIFVFFPLTLRLFILVFFVFNTKFPFSKLSPPESLTLLSCIVAFLTLFITIMDLAFVSLIITFPFFTSLWVIYTIPFFFVADSALYGTPKSVLQTAVIKTKLHTLIFFLLINSSLN